MMKVKRLPKILLHTCCGPCTIYPLRKLREEGWQVHGYFYNPHIQPYQEFEKRLATLESYAQREELKIIVRSDYELETFFRQVAFRENQRCIYCYAIRIEAAARLAKKSRFDAFTTTLLYSKRQKHDLVRDLAEEASRKHGLSFYYEDFRKGWGEGQEKAREQGMYRQQYCGCIFSEQERYKIKRESTERID
jgi:epoxyqueuosine reductase